MSWWTVFWIFWLILFLIVEGMALCNKKSGDTLSENVWEWFAIDVDACQGERKRGRVWMWRLRRLALLVLMAWLFMHFMFGGAF